MIDPQEPVSDEQIEEMLAPLRAVKLPDHAHAVNMAAVRRALSLRARSVWWQRTVAVPVPLAIAAIVALAFTTVVMLRPLRNPLKPDADGARPTQAGGIAISPATNSGGDLAADASWSMSRSYIGSLVNAHAFVITDSKEKRDAL
jgi:hypothetical protein